MRDRFEGVKEGLKYAFLTATFFEGLHMLEAVSLHVQPLDRFEMGAIAGVGFGVAGYVADNWNKVTVSGDEAKRRDEAAELSGGKVVVMPYAPPAPRL